MIFKLFVREAQLVYFYDCTLARCQFCHLVSDISFPQTIPRFFYGGFLFLYVLGGLVKFCCCMVTLLT
jgi:hypothetical protein